MKNTLIKAGFGKAVLPFLKDKPLAGYAAIRPACKEHDPLMVQSMVLSDGKTTAAVCSLDLLACDHLLKDALIDRLEKTDLTFDEILLCCTHTHSGYAGLLDTDNGFLKAARHFAMEPDPELIEKIAGQIERSLLEAADHLAPAKIFSCSFDAEGIASNRVDPSLGAPLTGHLLKFETEKQTALLCFFACHPTVLAPDNLQITADFPGAAREILKKAGIGNFLYFNGASGDLSCRYTRKESTFAECERLGGILARQILEAMNNMDELSVPALCFISGKTLLRLKKPLSLETARQDLDFWSGKEEQALQNGLDARTLREIRAHKEGAMAAFLYSRCRLEQADWPIDFSILFLGRLKFVFLPAELFSSLAGQYFDANTIPVCCTNGYNLYLADRTAHSKQTYEALSSPFEAGQAEFLMEEISRAL